VKHHLLIAVFLSVVVGAPAVASAQGDEIQVYTGGLAPVGVFNLTWHNNYTPDGIKTPEFPGAITSNKSLNGVTEWAYGITDWFEGGLYLPLYSRDENLGWKVDGFKLRTLFAVPDADDRTFVYGVNIEYSFNAKWWDTKRFTSEVRPIVGWHLKQFDLIGEPRTIESVIKASCPWSDELHSPSSTTMQSPPCSTSALVSRGDSIASPLPR